MVFHESDLISKTELRKRLSLALSVFVQHLNNLRLKDRGGPFFYSHQNCIFCAHGVNQCCCLFGGGNWQEVHIVVHFDDANIRRTLFLIEQTWQQAELLTTSHIWNCIAEEWMAKISCSQGSGDTQGTSESHCYCVPRFALYLWWLSRSQRINVWTVGFPLW